jgi:hypothetical protein
MPLKIRSMVGLIPIAAVNILFGSEIDKLEGFKKRMDWFIKNKPSLSRHITVHDGNYLLSLVNKEKYVHGYGHGHGHRKLVLIIFTDNDRFITGWSES